MFFDVENGFLGVGQFGSKMGDVGFKAGDFIVLPHDGDVSYPLVNGLIGSD